LVGREVLEASRASGLVEVEVEVEVGLLPGVATVDKAIRSLVVGLSAVRLAVLRLVLAAAVAALLHPGIPEAMAGLVLAAQAAQQAQEHQQGQQAPKASTSADSET
jgi:hypothetical protein